MSRKLIFLQVGQCGNQMGNAFWELQCLQNGLTSDGNAISGSHFSVNDDQNVIFDRFFDIVSDKKSTARTLLIDTDPAFINEIKCGAYRNLYNPHKLISSCEDAGNNFARGMIKYSYNYLDKCVDEIRLILEAIDCPDGIILLNSTGGGTGSGLSCILMQMMLLDYVKISKTNYFVVPNTGHMLATVEPYNSILSAHNIFDPIDLGIIASNDQLFKIEKNFLSVPTPNFSDINRILSSCLGTITSHPYSMTQTHTNLVPFPRIHFSFPSLSPLMPRSQIEAKIPLDLIANNLFNKTNFLVSFPCHSFLYISILVNFQGLFSENSFLNSIQKLKKDRKIKFVDWCPSGFKFQVSSVQTSISMIKNLVQPDVTVSLLSNSPAIKHTWKNLTRAFNTLLKRKAFIFWYLDEGLEESDFHEAYDDIEDLISNYWELEQSNGDFAKYLNRISQNTCEGISNPFISTTNEEASNTNGSNHYTFARSLIDMRMNNVPLHRKHIII